MNNRPDPVMFARYSYYLAFASSAIMLLAWLLSLIRIPAVEALTNIIWLALITGVAGTFMGYAARRDFKRKPGPEEAMGEARIGFRINLLATAVMVLFLVLELILRFGFPSTVTVK